MKSLGRCSLVSVVLCLSTTIASGQVRQSRFAYVATSSGYIAGYVIDPNTGALAPVPGSPFLAPNGLSVFSVTVDPSGRFLYAANGPANFSPYLTGGISAYTIDSSTGSLSLVSGSPYPAPCCQIGVASLTADPTGKFLYAVVAAYGYSAVEAYAMDQTSGALTEAPGSPFVVSTAAAPVSITPNGKFAYVRAPAYYYNGMELFGFAIDSGTGALSPVPGSPFSDTGATSPITIDPTGAFLYLPDPYYGILAFAINSTTGSPTQVPGSPFSAPIAISLTLDPSDRFAYTVDNSCGYPPDGFLTGFTVNGSTGGLSQISTFSAGNCPQTLTMDPRGRFMYVVQQSGILGYSIDPTTGMLSPIAGSPFPGNILSGLTMDSTGQFLYAANRVPSANPPVDPYVYAYSIDGATGALTAIPGSPFPAGNTPIAPVTLTPGPAPVISGPPFLITPIPPALGVTATGISSSPTSSLSNPTVATTSEPITTGNGNYVYQHTDFTLPGRGMPVVFQRSYNSLDSYSGPLGANWTHSYNISLFQDISGNITVKWGDGHGETFTLSGSIYIPQPGVFNTLAKNSDGTFVLTRKDQTQFAFSTVGKLTSIQDKNGNTIQLGYDGSGNLTQITDTVGRNLNFTYDSSNRITKITEPGSRSVSFQYAANNNLVQASDAAGGITSFTYDANHRVTSITQPNGQSLLQNAYDSSGRVVLQTGGRGFATTLAYGTPNPSDTTITDARGNATIHSYDASLRIIKISDAVGGATSFTYDANNDRTSVTNQNGKTTNFSYDSHGNVTGIVDPLANSVSFTYDAANNLLSATNAKAKTTSLTYSGTGNLTKIQDTVGNSTTFSYDSFGELTAKTDARGNTTNFVYDSLGSLTRITDALGHTTNLSYDSIGRLTSITDPNGHAATATYDALSRLVKISDPLGNQTQFAYDSIGNLLKITDANGNATSYAYDATNNLVTVTDALGHVTLYAYDANNNRTTFTNAKGSATSYAYDALNRLNKITDPLSLVTAYTYDAVGNVLAVKDAKGQTNQFTYDALNRLLGIAYADGKVVSYSYDANGNRTSMVDFHGTTAYSYDGLDRLLSVTHPGGKIVSYAFDTVGNRKSLTYPDGKTVNYAYDPANRLSQVTDWLARTTTYSYDAASNVTGITYPNGASLGFSYDGANRLLNVGNTYQGSLGNPISNFAYVLDAVGNRRAVTDGSGKLTAYLYDALNELNSVTVGTSVTAYAYDAAGNRLALSAPGTAVSYTYDAADRLLAAGNTTFSYDNNGNQIVKTPPNGKPLVYSYDAANRLISVVSGKTNNAFSYDGDGNRVSQTTGSGTYSYVNDIASALPVVLQESGPDGDISYVYGLGLISESGPGFDYFYQYDGLGSVVGLTDPKAKLAGRYSYDAWGNTDASVPAPQLGTENKFRFTGEALDPGTGLYYLRARYYDPSTGRLLTPDPFSGVDVLPLSKDGYIYARSNPIRFTDSSGLWSIPLLGTLIDLTNKLFQSLTSAAQKNDTSQDVANCENANFNPDMCHNFRQNLINEQRQTQQAVSDVGKLAATAPGLIYSPIAAPASDAVPAGDVSEFTTLFRAFTTFLKIVNSDIQGQLKDIFSIPVANAAVAGGSQK